MRRGIAITLLVVGLAAVSLATGVALMLFNHSNAFAFWLALFPIVATAALTAPLLRSRAGIRWMTAGALLLVDAVMVFGKVDRFDCGQTWEEARDMRAVVEIAPGFALRDDGKGALADATDRTKAYAHHTLALESHSSRNAGRRISLDLSAPVATSGAKPLGAVDKVISIKSYWFQDSAHMIRAVQSIRPDTTVTSDRTDIVFTISGRRHRLTMGSWTGRYCDAEPGVGGAGTSAASITRDKNNAFEVMAAKGATARLWDVSASDGPLGPRQAVDLGLYHVDFRVGFRAR